MDDGTAADCDVGVQAAHRLQTPCVHPRLLEGLPARRGPQVAIGRVDAATWERHLVGVGAQCSGTAGQDHSRVLLVVKTDQDGRLPFGTGRGRPTHAGGLTASDSRHHSVEAKPAIGQVGPRSAITDPPVLRSGDDLRSAPGNRPGSGGDHRRRVVPAGENPEGRARRPGPGDLHARRLHHPAHAAHRIHATRRHSGLGLGLVGH